MYLYILNLYIYIYILKAKVKIREGEIKKKFGNPVVSCRIYCATIDS